MMIVFGLMLFVVMLMAGGLAVDLMRHEAERTRVQNTADRASLAAAALRQELDPESVVRDYFEREGLSGNLTDVSVDGGLNYRNVEVETEASVSTLFMRLLGIDTLTATGASGAEERVPKVEVSLVLDISGSMRFTDASGAPQIDLLRPAAQEFIDTMLAGERRDLFSISIVPYAGSVNPGPQVFSALGVTQTHAASHCMELTATHFNSSAFPRSGTRTQVPHFMMWDIATSYMDWGWCPNDTTAAVQYWSSDATALKNYIQNMRLHDGTGTQIGMWWGLGLLDPANRWLMSELIATSVVDAKFADRPAPYTDPETLKVIVLMTDGYITEQFRPSDPSHPLNATRELTRRPSGDRTTLSSRNWNRDRFYQVCNRAKANGVVVYTIAFNTSGSAVTEMRNCASAPELFFDVQSFEINTAFRTIANSIRDLRLTQ
ncbi:MAG: pilus assembly protein TadG-related protein [Gemmobacter sp.]